jgi:hypothetical protein
MKSNKNFVLLCVFAFMITGSLIALLLLPETITHVCTYVGPLPDTVGYKGPADVAGKCVNINQYYLTKLSATGDGLYDTLYGSIILFISTSLILVSKQLLIRTKSSRKSK